VFHPVPRADRWDAVISSAGLLIVAAVLLATFIVGK